MSCSIFMLFFTLFISVSNGSQREILRVISKQESEKPDFAVELNATNFDSVLKETPAPYAIVEFFAHWCPACRNYKPQYEKVARLFNGADASHPGIILMTRVDCALAINSNLCDKFSVKYYPMLLWGPPKKFVGSGWDPKRENSEIIAIEKGRTADILLGWINKQLGRCRKGSADILVDFDNLCPSEMLANNEEVDSCSKKGALGNYQICGKEVLRGYWMYCRGSRNDTRGFSCGLWVLLHSLSVRVEDGESNLAFRTTCDFIRNFFICEECRQHFNGMCSSVSSPFKKARDYALWLWSAHNKVNERLMKDEESLGTGDPEFPKVIWPPKQLCPSCYLNPGKASDENSKIDWNEDEVFKFLVSYYGKELVNLYKDKELQAGGGTEKTVNEELVASTNAVVVPLGAALAIAVASCAFGALACFWRSQQKNRKPRRSWN